MPEPALLRNFKAIAPYLPHFSAEFTEMKNYSYFFSFNIMNLPSFIKKILTTCKIGPFVPNSCPIQGAIYVHTKSATGQRERAAQRVADKVRQTKTNTDPWRDTTMLNFIKNFNKSEAGAVTVDWVVLTAAVVGLAVAAYSSIQTGASDLTSATNTFMATQNP